jgi:molybdopterin-containing oxidoreductase family membrane subunit
MWLERFVIIVTSLSFDFIPAIWSLYYPTATDLMILGGTIGFFTLLFLLFVRALPPISIAEMRELIRHHGESAGLAAPPEDKETVAQVEGIAHSA